jgi:hypothetical protein
VPYRFALAAQHLSPSTAKSHGLSKKIDNAELAGGKTAESGQLYG